MDESETISRKPKDTNFKQQRLPAWKPILTAGTVLPVFFAVGVIFIPLGVALLITANNVQEIVIPYTDCLRVHNNGSVDTKTCDEVISNDRSSPCQCVIDFEIEKDLQGEVYMYYGLTNFYQNHRRYVRSRDDNQLRGVSKTASSLNSECAPFKVRSLNPDDKNSPQLPVMPCGSIANSMFNDTLSITHHPKNGNSTLVKLLRKNISWNTDRNVKFRNPEFPQGKSLAFAFNGTIKPINWKKSIYELDPSDAENNGLQNEDFIVWMRPAALSSFRKLHRRIDQSQHGFGLGMPKGSYRLNVVYNYPVKIFEGTKSMILTTTSWMGGHNPFLGIAYIVVGCLCIVVGLLFLIIHILVGKKPIDMISNITSQTLY